MGLSSTRFLKLQVTWLMERRWITIEARRSDALTDHRIRSNARVVNSGVLTAVIASCGMHLNVFHSNRGDQMCFITHLNGRIQTVDRDPTATIFLKRFTVDRFIVTVDRFDRTITPKMYINRGVLRYSKHSSWKSKQLICLDTSPLDSLDPIVFYTHFRTSVAFEIEILLSRLGEIDA